MPRAMGIGVDEGQHVVCRVATAVWWRQLDILGRHGLVWTGVDRCGLGCGKAIGISLI